MDILENMQMYKTDKIHVRYNESSTSDEKIIYVILKKHLH
jgi:hypothetical protein